MTILEKAPAEKISTQSQTLSGHDVLPGFELPVADVFADPFGQ